MISLKDDYLANNTEMSGYEMFKERGVSILSVLPVWDPIQLHEIQSGVSSNPLQFWKLFVTLKMHMISQHNCKSAVNQPALVMWL